MDSRLRGNDEESAGMTVGEKGAVLIFRGKDYCPIYAAPAFLEIHPSHINASHVRQLVGDALVAVDTGLVAVGEGGGVHVRPRAGSAR